MQLKLTEKIKSDSKSAALHSCAEEKIGKDTTMVVGLVGFMSAARDISTVVLLGSAQSRTMALLALDYTFGGQFERGSVVAFMTSIIVIITAMLARMVGGRVVIGGH